MIRYGVMLTLALFGGIILGMALLLPEHALADSFPILGTLHAGNRPEAMAVDTQTHLLYIAYESPGVVVAFDPLHNMVRWRASVGDIAMDVQVDSATHRVFVATSSSQQSDLLLMDGATGHVLVSLPIGSGDNGIALDAVRQRVYVACSDAGVVDAFTFVPNWQSEHFQVKTAQLPVGPHPQGIAVNSRLGRLYVADMVQNTVTVIDETSGRTLASIDVGAVPLQPIRIDEATNRIYVVCSTAQELDVIDGKANRVIARVPVGPYPEGIVIQSATGRIYVADEGSKEFGGGPQDSGTTITAIDVHSLAVLGTLQVGQAPDGIASDPALHQIYVATEQSNAMVEIADSPQMPLLSDSTFSRYSAARWAITLLQQATIITLLAMLLTFSGATLYALLPRWRGQGSPRTEPGDASSRSPQHNHPQ
jgi:YVTN family beta-propeller protein